MRKLFSYNLHFETAPRLLYCQHVAHRIRRLFLCRRRNPCGEMAQHAGNGLDIHSILEGQGGEFLKWRTAISRIDGDVIVLGITDRLHRFQRSILLVKKQKMLDSVVPTGFTIEKTEMR